MTLINDSISSQEALPSLVFGSSVRCMQEVNERSDGHRNNMQINARHPIATVKFGSKLIPFYKLHSLCVFVCLERTPALLPALPDVCGTL